MAKQKPTQTGAEPTEARALVDIPSLGVRCGRLIRAEAAVITALVAAGEADPHPDAVAYAKTIED